MLLKTHDIKRLVFSGHDSFQCRQLWLKKGYDFVSKGNSLNQDDAVVLLGVGKNMVSSIRYWLRAFNIIDNNDNPTTFGKLLFDEKNGYDPYLEDEGSLWLLHYQLVKNGYASIYSIIFNEFRKEKTFFSKDTFVNYVKRLSESNNEFNFNQNTISKDFIVFSKLYKHDYESKTIEDSYTGILSELDLVQLKSNEDLLFIDNAERDMLPSEIVLFAILDNPNYGNSISLNSLEFDWNSPGLVFALNRTGIINKIKDLTHNSSEITFSDQAGIKELQFSNKPDAYTVLDKYYGK
jgi:hypothetical protein